MSASLTGHYALVTGAEAGLGYAIAEGLAAAGAGIVMHCLHANEKAQQARDALEHKYSVSVELVQADLRDATQIDAMIADVLTRIPRIDILVNNAVIRHFEPAHLLPREHWNEGLAVNLSAPFHLAQLALPGMLKQQWGRIINVSSVYGSSSAPNRIGYITAKTALLGMTRALAIETAGHGITCNAVAPGTAPTPAIISKIAAIAQESGQPVEEAERAYLAARQPTGRFVAMENVAALIAFLCADSGRDITGATLPIDGGWTAV